MRERKFRALKDDISSCIWVYGYLVEDEEGNPYITKYTSDIGYKHTSCLKGTDGQFTGLKDKNGLDIYKGDILDTGKTMHRRPWQKGHNYHVVDFSNGAFIAKGWNGEIEVSPNLSSINHKSTVIGNIYETPELLKP